MSVENWEHDLMEWVAGEASPERAAQLEAHLRQCAECRAAARDLQALWAGLGALGVRGVAPAVSTGSAIRPRVRPFPAHFSLRWAAAAVIAAAVAGLGMWYVDIGSPGAGPRSVASSPSADSPFRSPASEQLRMVDEARATGARDRLGAFHRAPSAPVRLAALTAPGYRPASRPGSAPEGPEDGDRVGELVAAFEREEDLLVRLWIVVEVARSGDPAAARAIRAISVDERAMLSPELRVAIDSYLGTVGDEELSS